MVSSGMITGTIWFQQCKPTVTNGVQVVGCRYKWYKRRDTVTVINPWNVFTESIVSAQDILTSKSVQLAHRCNKSIAKRLNVLL